MHKSIQSHDGCIFTIGHSTRPIEEFIDMLKAHGVNRLIDIRTVPRSGHNPQFNGPSLAKALAEEDIGYQHIAGLGGFRRTSDQSPNKGWRNASFRGYADYMQTPEFAMNLKQVVDLAGQYTLALMCAEAVPWRCHRSLVADALLIKDKCVEEIVSNQRTQPHKLTPFAKVHGAILTYPMQDEQLSLPLTGAVQ
jgi:uncharacterized protein (DUF488 family)